MDKITITEALAELKVIEKRLQKKQDTVLAHLVRQYGLRDPLEKETGGSAGYIGREEQSFMDLAARIIVIRTAINEANMKNPVTVQGSTMTIAAWIVWKREVAPVLQKHMAALRQAINQTRMQAPKQNAVVMASANVSTDAKATDWLVNIDEAKLANQIEFLEVTLAELDGQLSLKNATLTIEI